MNIKNARLPSRNLPPVNKDNEYAYRYRVTSEDRNRISEWSPIKVIAAPTVEFFGSSGGDVAVSGNSITATWSDENNRPNYDVFVKFNTDPHYSYHGTTPIHTYSFVKKTGATAVSVAIQVEGIFVDGIKPFYTTTPFDPETGMGNKLLVFVKENKAL
jgi:hypothetical protein